nr:hypothetical protein [Clostridium paraputrificum]
MSLLGLQSINKPVNDRTTLDICFRCDWDKDNCFTCDSTDSDNEDCWGCDGWNNDSNH